MSTAARVLITNSVGVGCDRHYREYGPTSQDVNQTVKAALKRLIEGMIEEDLRPEDIRREIFLLEEFDIFRNREFDNEHPIALEDER